MHAHVHTRTHRHTHFLLYCLPNLYLLLKYLQCKSTAVLQGPLFTRVSCPTQFSKVCLRVFKDITIILLGDTTTLHTLESNLRWLNGPGGSDCVWRQGSGVNIWEFFFLMYTCQTQQIVRSMLNLSLQALVTNKR